MNPRLSLALLVPVLIAFGAWTAVIVLDHGYTGFVELALREAWGGQMFVDLVIALLLFATWMRDDAARLRLPYWPYLALVLFTGSIGALAYLVHRAARGARAVDPVTAA